MENLWLLALLGLVVHTSSACIQTNFTIIQEHYRRQVSSHITEHIDYLFGDLDLGRVFKVEQVTAKDIIIAMITVFEDEDHWVFNTEMNWTLGCVKCPDIQLKVTFQVGQQLGMEKGCYKWNMLPDSFDGEIQLLNSPRFPGLLNNSLNIMNSLLDVIKAPILVLCQEIHYAAVSGLNNMFRQLRRPFLLGDDHCHTEIASLLDASESFGTGLVTVCDQGTNFTWPVFPLDTLPSNMISTAFLGQDLITDVFEFYPFDYEVNILDYEWKGLHIFPDFSGPVKLVMSTLLPPRCLILPSGAHLAVFLEVSLRNESGSGLISLEAAIIVGLNIIIQSGFIGVRIQTEVEADLTINSVDEECNCGDDDDLRGILSPFISNHLIQLFASLSCDLQIGVILPLPLGEVFADGECEYGEGYAFLQSHSIDAS